MIAIISVLTSILLPALALAKEKARSVSCLSHLKQIGLAIVLYAGDHDDHLVPAELNTRNGARYEEGWPTLLTLGGYLPAPRKVNHGDSPGSGASVFRCPSGIPKVYEFNPASRDDTEGAKAYPFKSESSGNKFYVDCWYGINGGLGSAEKYPFSRLPSDEGGRVVNRLSRVTRASQTPSIFDGWWILNGKDERINARHGKGTRSNVLFLDGAARSYQTFALPSVSTTNHAEVSWQL